MIRLADTPFRDILPGSISGDATVAAAADALDRELSQVSSMIDFALVYPRLDELEGDILNLLAWQFNVDFFDIALPDTLKREAIRKSIAWHRKKGTAWAVRTALANAGYGSEIFTYQDLRKALDAKDSLRLDGAWPVDGSERLGSLSDMAGAAWMEHWAQFCVKLDMLSFERPGYESEVRNIVNVAKNERSHPVYYYFMQLESEAPVDIESSGGGGKLLECLPLQCATLLDGTWRVGQDARAISVDGSWTLGADTALGGILPGVPERSIINCRMSGGAGGGSLASVRAGVPAEPESPWFRLESKMRQIDGGWGLGGNISVDGSWKVDGRLKLEAPTLGEYALNRLTDSNKVGLVPPESESWPQISGGVYGSSSINGYI